MPQAGEPGVILGRDRATGELIRHAGEAHAMTFAATGKGKTVGPVITNARTHPGQFVCVDPKGEVFDLSADHRRRFGPVHALDLRDDAVLPDCLNPLDIGRRLGSEPSSVARSMARDIAPLESGYGRNHDQFWNRWSVSLIHATILRALETHPEQATLSAAYEGFAGDDPVYRLAARLDSEGKQLPKESYRAFSGFLELTDVTRSGVIGTVIADLEIFGTALSRRLADNTSIDLDALMDGQPISIYLIASPDRIRAFAALLRLWLSLLMLLMTRRKAKPRHPTLFLIDEAAQLGRMEALLMAQTLLRSFSLRCWTIWQSASQLKMYGDDAETLLDNAGIVQVMGLANMRAARDTADLMGGITAEELMALEPDEQALMIDGRKPFVAKQVRYYQERGIWPEQPLNSPLV